MTTAVVLAGGPVDAVAAMQPGAANKAFVKVGGMTLVERTLLALRQSAAIDRIIVVAPAVTHNDAALTLANEFRTDGKRIRDSLRSGLAGLPPDDPVLVSTSDLPVMTAPAVDDFIARARTLDPDIGYGCIEARTHRARYPDVPHTWARLRDGTYCGSGLITVKPRVLHSLDRFIESLGAARKNPLRLASLFGWDVLLRFALRRLSIEDAEERAQQLLGAPARAIVSPYPEIAVNVDRVSDIALAEKLVSAK